MPPALYASLEALATDIEAMGRYPASYWDRMMHKVPAMPSVERIPWLVAHCTGQTVLHLGCEGPLHAALHKVTTRLYGVDHVDKQAPDYFNVDLDLHPDELPALPDVTLILAAEVLEHLTSPGWVLRMCRESYPTVPMIITVPNAFAPQPKQGYECVNADHVSWYSYWTLTSFVRKCGYTVHDILAYNGRYPQSEGLIVVAKAAQG